MGRNKRKPWKMNRLDRQQARTPQQTMTPDETEHAFRKNWGVKCMNCRQKPTVGDTGLCGPCCFGEADTVNGNW